MPKPRVGVVGTDMEWGPMGELMTEKGGPMPLMGELRVLMGECSCPGEPSEEPMPGPREGCSEGAAMEPRPVGELRDEEFTWVEKSARQESQGGGQGSAQTGLHPLGQRPQEATEGGEPAQGKAPGTPSGWLLTKPQPQGQGGSGAPVPSKAPP